MKTLNDIYNSPNVCDMNGMKSDKNTAHSYIDVYELLFDPIRETTKYFLEIGIKCGSSIPLWHEYFYNSAIFAVDNNTDYGQFDGVTCTPQQVIDFCKGFNRVQYFPFTDAYSQSTIELLSQSLNKNLFDVIIDDGSHFPEHQAFVMTSYLNLLRSGGMIVIEDVKNESVVDFLYKIAGTLDVEFQVADLRHIKSRGDDIMVVITKK